MYIVGPIHIWLVGLSLFAYQSHARDGPGQVPGAVVGEVNGRGPADHAKVRPPGQPASHIPLHGLIDGHLYLDRRP